MRRSKLETNVDILKALARHGPLKLTHIMYKANVNCSILKQQLNSLIEQNLVEATMLRKKTVAYAIREKGRRVLKTFWELNKAFQLTEEEEPLLLLY
ncbi:ArsR family transcriptional regulator [Candidatus Bathyarchaeota archaeon]|nr:MAG: ArsR family transcriptional regulator [Candidatus Bathyarchaeota archaeon]